MPVQILGHPDAEVTEGLALDLAPRAGDVDEAWMMDARQA